MTHAIPLRHALATLVLLFAGTTAFAGRKKAVTTASASATTVSVADEVTVIFTLYDDTARKIDAHLDDFTVVRGPEMSQSTNTTLKGKKYVTTFSVSMSYVLRPKHTGTLVAGPATIISASGTYACDGVTITVTEAGTAQEKLQLSAAGAGIVAALTEGGYKYVLSNGLLHTSAMDAFFPKQPLDNKYLGKRYDFKKLGTWYWMGFSRDYYGAANAQALVALQNNLAMQSMMGNGTANYVCATKDWNIQDELAFLQSGNRFFANLDAFFANKDDNTDKQYTALVSFSFNDTRDRAAFIDALSNATIQYKTPALLDTAYEESRGADHPYTATVSYGAEQYKTSFYSLAGQLLNMAGTCHGRYDNLDMKQP